MEKKRTEEWKNETVEFLKDFIKELDWENFKTYNRVQQRETINHVYQWVHKNAKDLDVLSEHHEIISILVKRLLYIAGKRSEVLNGRT